VISILTFILHTSAPIISDRLVVTGQRDGRVLCLKLHHLQWFNAYKALEPSLVDLLHVDAAQVDFSEESLALMPLVNIVEIIFGVVKSKDGVTLPYVDLDQPAEPLQRDLALCL
jgi:hypothetical protein